MLHENERIRASARRREGEPRERRVRAGQVGPFHGGCAGYVDRDVLHAPMTPWAAQERGCPMSRSAQREETPVSARAALARGRRAVASWVAHYRPAARGAAAHPVLSLIHI